LYESRPSFHSTFLNLSDVQLVPSKAAVYFQIHPIPFPGHNPLTIILKILIRSPLFSFLRLPYLWVFCLVDRPPPSPPPSSTSSPENTSRKILPSPLVPFTDVATKDGLRLFTLSLNPPDGTNTFPRHPYVQILFPIVALQLMEDPFIFFVCNGHEAFAWLDASSVRTFPPHEPPDNTHPASPSPP